MLKTKQWFETKEGRESNDAFEKYAHIGYGIVPNLHKKSIQEYDYRAMSHYAQQKGITSMDLTAEELRKFEYA